VLHHYFVCQRTIVDLQACCLPLTTVTIPPITRKRKAAEATITSTDTETPPQKKVVASAGLPAAPPTPVTTRDMDSEEEYMSPISTDDDEIMQDDSGDELSGPDGKPYSTFFPLPAFSGRYCYRP
jgi:ariadne-1